VHLAQVLQYICSGRLQEGYTGSRVNSALVGELLESKKTCAEQSEKLLQADKTSTEHLEELLRSKKTCAELSDEIVRLKNKVRSTLHECVVIVSLYIYCAHLTIPGASFSPVSR
jgi:hypothetical protein